VLPPGQMILPPATLGMLGGGQLGRFFVGAAHELGYRVWVLDPDAHSPAGRLADRHLQADYTDQDALLAMAEGCAAVSTEFENVPAVALEQLAKFVPVRPGAAAVAVCQHRVAEKTFLREQRIPHAPFAVIRDEADFAALPAALFPGILKVARNGYDGKGQARVADADEARLAWRGFQHETCVIEACLPLERELSVVLARSANGEVRCFPAAENSHRNGILDVSIVPARIDETLRDEAMVIARSVAERLAYVGVLAVEFFVCDGRLYVNEMAPRPHNSGHYTIDACHASQFEQQVRVLCGLPLGDSAAHSSAVMVNLLGELWYPGGDAVHPVEPPWADLLAVPGLALHLYGKHHARPGRKMGHFTLLGRPGDAPLAEALAARRAIGIEA
jgi:5-(carboxyamino)imidazole ribonucleotide synthase